MCTPQLAQMSAVKVFTFKEMMMSDNTKLGFWVVVLIFLVAVGPLCTIWALNTLFPALAIPVTFETWVATVILFGFAKSGFSTK